MHITHVFHHYHPVVGGMERVVQFLAEEQVKTGHEVHVITSVMKAKSRSEEEIVKNVHVHRVKSIRFHYPDLTYPIKYPKEILKKSDVIHIHSQNSLFNVILAKRTKEIGKPVVMDFLALNYLKFHPSFFIRFSGGFYQKMLQIQAARLADVAITTNKRDYQILKNEYRIKSEIVQHGINEEYLARPRDSKTFKRKYGVYDENIIAYVGRIHPSKGLDYLVKATSIIAKEINNFVMVVAGNGNECYLERLKELAKKLGVHDKVRFLGYISEEDKISLLDASRIFVLPSRHFGENYSLSIDEAYARGVPVIATRVGVLPYKIKHLETGILVPVDDFHSLAKAIITLLKDDSLLVNMREKLQSIRGSLLTWKQVCKKLDGIYHNLIGETDLWRC
jgi:glycosyltransferase involved in cell wall biosynthesis